MQTTLFENMQAQEEGANLGDQYQEEEALWDEFGGIEMQEVGHQEHNINDGGANFPPQVQLQNDQVSNDGAVPQNHPQKVNLMNIGAQGVQVQNIFDQNLSGGFQAGYCRNNFNQLQGAGGNAHDGRPNGGVVGMHQELYIMLEDILLYSLAITLV